MIVIEDTESGKIVGWVWPTGTDETAYYVLRTHNEDVRKVTGGTAEKLEEIGRAHV